MLLIVVLVAFLLEILLVMVLFLGLLLLAFLADGLSFSSITGEGAPECSSS